MVTSSVPRRDRPTCPGTDTVLLLEGPAGRTLCVGACASVPQAFRLPTRTTTDDHSTKYSQKCQALRFLPTLRDMPAFLRPWHIQTGHSFACLMYSSWARRAMQDKSLRRVIFSSSEVWLARLETGQRAGLKGPVSPGGTGGAAPEV